MKQFHLGSTFLFSKLAIVSISIKFTLLRTSSISIKLQLHCSISLDNSTSLLRANIPCVHFDIRDSCMCWDIKNTCNLMYEMINDINLGCQKCSQLKFYKFPVYFALKDKTMNK